MSDDKFIGHVGGYGSTYQPCLCCGARLRKSDSKIDLKRSDFINIKASQSENFISQNGKREIVCVETSNGPLTLGMRYEW